MKISSIALCSLLILVAATSCKRPPPPGAGVPAAAPKKVQGMTDFDYLACDGGPHLILPTGLSSQWKGVRSIADVLNPSSDPGRAMAATKNQKMTLIPVGIGQAMVLDNPPLSSWGHSPEGWIDIYYLNGWDSTDLDALLKRAVAATPTTNMTDTGKQMTLTEPGLILLFSGDRPGNTAYGEYAIPMDAGSYQILEGHYKAGVADEIYIYRFQPAKK